MDQSIINLILGAAGAVFSFLLHIIWTTVTELQKADHKLVDKVAAIELLVAGNYVKREEFDKVMVRMFQKLDNIDNKIDRSKLAEEVH